MMLSQTLVSAKLLTVGGATSVMFTTSVEEQLFVAVPVTVYTLFVFPVNIGLEILGLLSPIAGDHEYVWAPVLVKTIASGQHKVLSGMVATVGTDFIVTVKLLSVVQVPLVAVSVMV